MSSAANKALSAFRNLCNHADEILLQAELFEAQANDSQLTEEQRADAAKRQADYDALWNFIQGTFAQLPGEVQPTAAFIFLIGSDAFARCTPVSAQRQEWSTCKMVEQVVDTEKLQQLCSATPEYADLVETACDDSAILSAEPPANPEEFGDE